MTREEEILIAARGRADRHQIAEMVLYRGDKCNYSYERIYNSEIASFEAGAKYADKNKPSPWISVKDDLPCNYEELWIMTSGLIYTKKVLVVLTDNTVKLLSMLYDEVNDKWKWESILKDKIIYWMPIPNLPKE